MNHPQPYRDAKPSLDAQVARRTHERDQLLYTVVPSLRRVYCRRSRRKVLGRGLVIGFVFLVLCIPFGVFVGDLDDIHRRKLAADWGLFAHYAHGTMTGLLLLSWAVSVVCAVVCGWAASQRFNRHLARIRSLTGEPVSDLAKLRSVDAVAVMHRFAQGQGS